MSPTPQLAGDEACYINIGPKQRAQRMGFGIFMLLVSVGIEVLLVAQHSPRAWRLGLFMPLFVAAIGVFQAREKT